MQIVIQILLNLWHFITFFFKSQNKRAVLLQNQNEDDIGDTWKDAERALGEQLGAATPSNTGENQENHKEGQENPTGAISGVRFYDLRDVQTQPIPRSRVRGGKTVLRNPQDINGICFHQTATVFGVSDKQLKNAGGNRELARATRFLNVPAHAVVSNDGFWVVHSPLEAYLNHGHGLNAFTLGVEIEGKYDGKNNENKIPDVAIAAVKEAVKYLVEEGKKLGMPIEYVYAHRQSTTKPSDPGAEIWQRIVLDYAVKELGLKPRNDYKMDLGRTIPKEWDPNSKNKY